MTERVNANGHAGGEALTAARQTMLALGLREGGDDAAALALLERAMQQLAEGQGVKVRHLYRAAALCGLLCCGWPKTQDALDETVRAACYAGDALAAQ
jgi:hypothetical protein